MIRYWNDVLYLSNKFLFRVRDLRIHILVMFHPCFEEGKEREGRKGHLCFFLLNHSQDFILIFLILNEGRS